jgi:hypothetical protein
MKVSTACFVLREYPTYNLPAACPSTCPCGKGMPLISTHDLMGQGPSSDGMAIANKRDDNREIKQSPCCPTISSPILPFTLLTVSYYGRCHLVQSLGVGSTLLIVETLMHLGANRVSLLQLPIYNADKYVRCLRRSHSSYSARRAPGFNEARNGSEPPSQQNDSCESERGRQQIRLSIIQIPGMFFAVQEICRTLWRT